VLLPYLLPPRLANASLITLAALSSFWRNRRTQIRGVIFGLECPRLLLIATTSTPASMSWVRVYAVLHRPTY